MSLACPASNAVLALRQSPKHLVQRHGGIEVGHDFASQDHLVQFAAGDAFSFGIETADVDRWLATLPQDVARGVFVGGRLTSQMVLQPYTLTDGRDLVLTPRFSPSTQEITYMSFGSRDPRVVLLNIETGQREIVGNFAGMSFSPRFSPDGQRVIMSLQQGSNSNIYTMDLRSKQMSRLTETTGIDTAPSYSPDGARICFESDRGGKQQIYVMPSSGGAAQRISFGEGSYSTPVWSPRGDAIAFTKQKGGSFAIGIMKPDGSGERILTDGYHNEGPTFAPNGRVVMFFREPSGSAGPSPRDRYHPEGAIHDQP